MVKLISYQSGYWTVEEKGERYKVFGPLVDSGFLFELNGRWLPRDDPRVSARLREESSGG